jgi:hypothetical protein
MALPCFFHTVEKSPQSSSIVWKSGGKVVPLRGKISPIFPQRGKYLSRVRGIFPQRGKNRTSSLGFFHR